MTSRHSQMILVYLIASYSALLVASVAGGAKIISVPFGMAASATVFSYALTFPITDVISEVYGERTARATVRSGFIGMLLAVLFFEVSIAAPPFAGWTLQESYVETLSQARRILIGGWTAFIVSQHLDVWVFHRIREATQGRHLWLRNLASTGLGQLVDTVIFVVIAFYGTLPLVDIMLGQYLVKLGIAVLDTAPVYWAVKLIQGRPR